MLLLAAVYCAAIVAASLAGGWLPAWFSASHRRMELSVSFVAGVMLGIGLLNLMPHALQQVGDLQHGAYGIMAGLLTMFFIERFFCFHHHDAPEEILLPNRPPAAEEGAHSPTCDHDHHGHDHHGAHHHGHHLTWGGAAIGMVLHTLIGGIALAASMENESRQATAAAWPAGLGMFLVIVLHKPFDALTLGTLMAKGGWPAPWRQAVNLLFALVTPIGMALFYVLGSRLAHDEFLGWALAFSAGAFLCVALSDLLPELQFHQHDRLALSAALVAGIGIAVAVSVLERMAHGH